MDLQPVSVGDIVQPKYDVIVNDNEVEMACDEIGTVVQFFDFLNSGREDWAEIRLANGEIKTVPTDCLDIIKRYEPPINDPTKYDRGLFDD